MDMLRQTLARTPLPRLAHLLRIVWLNIRRPLTFGTRAIIPDANGQVLLIRHSYVGGWHLPGGGVGRGETLRQAMIREVREEVGVEVTGPVRMLGLYGRFRHRASDHVGIFVVEHWQGTPHVDGLEIVAVGFFSPDALPDDTTPATQRRLAEWRGESPVSELW